MKNKKGGAAFPHTVYHANPVNSAMRGTEIEHDGMTLRAYIAAAALTGIMANPENNQRLFEEDVALALDTADAMLKRLAEPANR